MSSPESSAFQPNHEQDRTLKGVEGEGSNIWARTAGELDVTQLISSELFAGSNLMRKLEKSDHIKREAGRSAAVETSIKRTKLSALVGEVYKRILPRDMHEFAVDLESQASQEEIAYIAEGMAYDPEYRNHLRQVAANYQDSLLMRGFKAFAEASWDFEGEEHQALIEDGRLFAAFLIEINTA